jgi:hypothetical protein
MEEQFARTVVAVLLLAVSCFGTELNLCCKNKVLSSGFQDDWKANRNVSCDIGDKILYVSTNFSEKEIMKVVLYTKFASVT